MYIVFMFFLSMGLAASAHAVDLSVDASSDKQIGRARDMSYKDSIDRKVSTLHGTAKDTSVATSTRRDHKVGRDVGSTLSIHPSAILPAFGLKYLLLVDLGLATKMNGGWINQTEQDFIEKAWKSGAEIGVIGDVAEIDQYIDRIIKTGMIAAQAEIYLQERIARLSASKSLDKKGKAVLNLAAMVGLDDLPGLALEAWRDANTDVSNPRLLNLLQRIQDEKKNNPCRLYGGNAIACGNLVLTVANPPKLQLDTIIIYDGTTFAGVSGDLKVALNSSLSASFDKNRSISDSVKDSTDRSGAEGHAFEAALAKKNALNSTTTAKTSLSPGKFVK